MLDRRLWSNIGYIFLVILVSLTVWQILTSAVLTKFSIDYSTTLHSADFPNSTRYRHATSTLLQSDYNQLINLTFTFNILSLVCNDSGSSPLLLITVHSATGNHKKRDTIRRTWGRSNPKQVRVVFLVGLPFDTATQTRLSEEYRAHGDIVQGTFLDTYKNITYKHVMLLKYAIYHCPQAKYVLKTDDDVFVNMPTLVNLLTNDLAPHKLLLCTPRKNAIVYRTYRSKWRVSFSDYPRKRYPTYCPGWNLLYSADVVFDLYREAQRAPYFWIDDVHITGTLAEKIGLNHQDVEPFVLKEKTLHSMMNYAYEYSEPFLYGPANLQATEIEFLWNYVRNHTTPKYISIS